MPKGAKLATSIQIFESFTYFCPFHCVKSVLYSQITRGQLGGARVLTFPGDVRLTVCGRFSFIARPPASLALFSLNNTHSLPPTPLIPTPSRHRWSPDRVKIEAHLDDSLLHSLFSSQLRRRASRLPPAQSQRNPHTIPIAQPSANRLPSTTPAHLIISTD